MLTRESLKNHWWFRLLKVLFIVLIIAAMGLVLTASFGDKPVLDQYASSYQYRCNGETALRGNIKGTDVDFWSGTPVMSAVNDDKTLRFICTNPATIVPLLASTTAFDAAYYEASIDDTIPASDNYNILISKASYDGSWWNVLIGIVLGTLAVVVIAWLIKSIFMYVLVGATPRNPFKRRSAE